MKLARDCKTTKYHLHLGIKTGEATVQKGTLVSDLGPGLNGGPVRFLADGHWHETTDTKPGLFTDE